MTVFQQVKNGFQQVSASDILMDILCALRNLSSEAVMQVYVDSSSKARVKIKDFALEPELVQSGLKYISDKGELITTLEISIEDACKEVYLSNFNKEYDFIWIQKGAAKPTFERRGTSNIFGMLIGIDFDLTLLKSGLTEEDLLLELSPDNKIMVYQT